jgi:DNA (cytosine-5)-methyltransferase 1
MTTSAPSSLSILDLFSGIGGFSYAAEQLVGGFHTVAFCDTDKACHKVLAKHWPATPIFPDIRELTAADIKPLCPNGLSLITAGFPCQDLSVAGKQAGYDGERSVLFYEIIRLARELRPKFLLLENVRNLLSHQNGETFQETLFQIAKAGYDAEWAVIPASDVGACHRRERIWIVAYASSGRNVGLEEHTGGSFQLECMGETGAVDVANAECRTAQLRRSTGELAGQTGSTEGQGYQRERGGLTPGSGGETAHAEDVFGNGGLSEQRGQFGGSAFSKPGDCDWTDAANANEIRPCGQDLSLSSMCGSNEGREIELGHRSGTWTQRGEHGDPRRKSLNPEWTSYVSEPVLCRGDDGLSNRVDRLKQLGNSIVPQVAAIPLQRIKDLALSQALSEL